ncbi:MAG: DNA polymerase III subunit delta [Planctomycetia bacterium]|nr:DNA polymerase III subunit delta [Planctomycetia bacterium]
MNSSITQLMNSLKNGGVDPVYLLQGKDKYLQQFLSDKIAERFFKDSKSDKILLIPDDMKGPEIIEQITATDLFSSKKMFILLDPQKISGQSRKEFLSYCDKPIQSNCLVIILEEFGKNVAMVRELTNRFTTINISSPFERDMKKWVQYFLREEGIKANTGIVNTIVEMAGDSVGHIANEIDKISILLDEGQELTDDLVRQFSGWKREHQRWEFFKYLGNKDLKNSLKIGLSLITQNETMLTLIYPLTAFFQELLYTKLSPDIVPGRSGYVPLSNSIVKNLPNYVKKYSRKEIELALKILGEIDVRSKTTTVSDESEMTKFLFNLLGNNDR